MPDAGPPPQGKQFGRYVIQRELGRGGMGIVYKALDPQLHRDVALKVLIGEDAAADPDRVKRFLREAHSVAKLRHPNVVAIHDIGVIGRQNFFTMEFIEGGSLEAKIRTAQEGRKEAARLSPPTVQPLSATTKTVTTKTFAPGRPPSTSTLAVRPLELSRIETAGPYNLYDTLVLVRDVARGLGAAHAQSIVHRDVKPANILIDGKGVPYLTDFGLAKEVGELAKSVLTLTGTVMGTPRYMSPEQASGKVNEIGPPSDVWSLGVVLYEMLTLKCPFDGDSLGEMFSNIAKKNPPSPSMLLRGGKRASSATMRAMTSDVVQGVIARGGQAGPRVPPQVDLIVMKCLEKGPADRYPDGGALADDIDRYLTGKEVEANTSMALQHARITSERKRASAAKRSKGQRGGLVALGVGVPLLAIAVLVWVSMSRKDSAEAAHAAAVAQAKGLVEAKQWKQAQEWIEAKLREFPADPALAAKKKEVEGELARVREAILQADAAFDKKDFVAAGASYKDALAIDPSDEKAKSRSEEVQKQLSLLEGAIANGDELLRVGKAADALDWYNKALAISPNDPRALTGVERAKGAKKDPSAMSHGTRNKEAEEYFEKARHRPMENKDAWAEALGNLDKALALDAEYGDAWHERGVLNMRLGRLKDSLDDFKKAIQYGSFLVYSHYYRGRILFDNFGQTAEARAEFQAAIDADPKHEYVLAARARIAAADGDLAGALSFARQALEKTKTLDDVYFVMGFVYGTQGPQMNLDKAIEDFDKSIDLNPTLAAAWGNRAMVRYMRKEFEKGLADADKALELTDGAAMQYEKRALNLTGLRRYAEAIAAYDEADKKGGDAIVSTYINRGDCYKTWAMSLLQGGDSAGARDKFEHTVTDWQHFLKLMPSGPYHDAVAHALPDVQKKLDSLK